MIYCFVDETNRYYPPPERFLASACIAVRQTCYDPRVAKARAMLSRSNKTPFLEILDKALIPLGGFTVIGTAHVDPTVLRLNEFDRSRDIPAMSRTDNAWAAAVIYTVARALARLVEHHVVFSIVALYFDPRSLKAEHWGAVCTTLRSMVPEVHRDWCDEHGFRRGQGISISHIEWIPKHRGPGPCSKFQVGTLLADRAVAQAKHPQADFSRVEFFDISDLVTEHLLRFDVQH